MKYYEGNRYACKEFKMLMEKKRPMHGELGTHTENRRDVNASESRGTVVNTWDNNRRLAKVPVQREQEGGKDDREI